MTAMSPTEWPAAAMIDPAQRALELAEEMGALVHEVHLRLGGAIAEDVLRAAFRRMVNVYAHGGYR